MQRENISASTLSSLLDYHPMQGILTWKKRSPDLFAPHNITGLQETSAKIWNKRYAGKPAFTALNHSGYHTGRVFDVGFLAHRVAWAIYYNTMPSGEIDHINHTRTDNRIVNLREVYDSENQRNMSMYSSNTSGMTGVAKKQNRWHAQIGYKGEVIHLGYFDTAEGAIDARRAAESKYGFHNNHGRGPN